MVNYLEIKVENRRKMYVNGNRNTFAVCLNCTNQSATSIDSSCHCDHKNQSQQNLHFTKKIHCLVNQLLLKWERKYFLSRIWKIPRTIISLVYMILFQSCKKNSLVCTHNTTYECFWSSNFTNTCPIHQIFVAHLYI